MAQETSKEQKIPVQHQDRQPGIESEMIPKPREDDEKYRGSGKLTVECNSTCRVNVRQDEGPLLHAYGEDGQEYDITRTKGGKWRGPIGPVHIPIEDARRPEES